MLRLPSKIAFAVVGTMGLSACPTTPSGACNVTTCTTDAALAISQSDASPDNFDPGCQNFTVDAGACSCALC